MESNSFANEDKYRRIGLKEAITEYRRHTHAAHVLFWTIDNTRAQHIVYGLMQMRSDGKFGFPGGKSDEECVDENEIISALYREIREEMNYRLTEGQITLEDLLFSHYCRKDGKILHFFAKQLALDVFEGLENTYKSAESFPTECVGLIRVPFSVVSESTSKSVRRFFNGFSRQTFAGNARNQLLDSIIHLNLIADKDKEFVRNLMKS